MKVEILSTDLNLPRTSQGPSKGPLTEPRDVYDWPTIFLNLLFISLRDSSKLESPGDENHVQIRVQLEHVSSILELFSPR